MSTRAIVKVRDAYGDEQGFRRHGDGCPEGTMPTLERFLSWAKEGRVRDNVSQAAGWLVVLGHEELGKGKEPGPAGDGYGWQAGSYEPWPSAEEPGDTEWRYVVDLGKLTITAERVVG